MIDRLQMVMDYYALSPSQLADSIGVPRSSISHLLSGRNKPSLDFILKLTNTYPDVNLYWILKGEGSFPTAANRGGLLSKQPKRLTESSSNISGDSETDIAPLELKETEQLERIVFFFNDGTFQTFSPK